MVRMILGAACLVALVGLTAADEKKADNRLVSGKFRAFKNGVLTIGVLQGLGAEPKENKDFKVPDDLKCTVYAGGEQKDGVPAGDALKDLKADTLIRITLDGDKITRMV